MKIKPRNRKSSGVTIIGVLIGAAILSIALVSQVRLLGDTIKREADLRHIITATNLAREGIELTFAKRLTVGWNFFETNINNEFCLDIKLDNWTPPATCTETLRTFKKIADTGGSCTDCRYFFYGDDNDSDPNNTNGKDSGYWRKIKLENCEISTGGDTTAEDTTTEECVKVTATVGWGSPDDTNKQVHLSKQMFNWYIP